MTSTGDEWDRTAPVEALLVDLDGTLVDSSAASLRAWGAFARRHGLDEASTAAFAQGRPTRETVAILAPEADHAAEVELLEQAENGDTEGIVPLPGAAALLAGRLPCAVVTGCSARLAATRLGAAGLAPPRIMVSSDDVRRGKPDPEGYLLAARLLAVAPARCVAFEDAPAGILAARAARVRVVALRTTHPDAELVAADALAQNLAAALDWLQLR